jgi:antitoxin ParD1/3/4
MTSFVIIDSCSRKEEIAMNVSLTPDLEQFVHGKVQSGRYSSSSEVIREALRLLGDHDRVRSAQITEFNQELDRRLASLDRGGQIDPAAARARLLRKSQKRRRPSG